MYPNTLTLTPDTQYQYYSESILIISYFPFPFPIPGTSYNIYSSIDTTNTLGMFVLEQFGVVWIRHVKLDSIVVLPRISKSCLLYGREERNS